MNLTKKEIGQELKEKLKNGYDAQVIADWAYKLVLGNRRQLSDEIENILDGIAIMDAGPEFVVSEKEMQILAELLIAEVDEPMKKLDDIKANGIHRQNEQSSIIQILGEIGIDRYKERALLENISIELEKLKMKNVPTNESIKNVTNTILSLESYYATLTRTASQGGKILPEELDDISELKRKINNITTNSAEEKNAIKECRLHIEKLEWADSLLRTQMESL